MGPKQIAISQSAWQSSSSNMVDNPYTLLHSTDFVFVDPIGTGYSRVQENVDETSFFGIREDSYALAQFI